MEAPHKDHGQGTHPPTQRTSLRLQAAANMRQSGRSSGQAQAQQPAQAPAQPQAQAQQAQQDFHIFLQCSLQSKLRNTNIQLGFALSSKASELDGDTEKRPQVDPQQLNSLLQEFQDLEQDPALPEPRSVDGLWH